MKTLSDELNETLEQCQAVDSDSVCFSTIRQNLNKVEQYVEEGKLDRALLFANMVAEDSQKLIQDISEKKK